MVAVLVWLSAGVTATVRFEPLPPNTTLELGTRAVFEEPLLNIRVPGALSASPMTKGMAPVDVSSSIDWSETLEIVGGVLMAFTVKTKESPLLFVPSLTVIVIVAAPI